MDKKLVGYFKNHREVLKYPLTHSQEEQEHPYKDFLCQDCVAI